MFTLHEKEYLLKLLKKEKRKKLFKSTPKVNDQLIGKIEQMIRNEHVNSDYLNR